MKIRKETADDIGMKDAEQVSDPDAESQIDAWQRANRRMQWNIPKDEFRSIPPAPILTDADLSKEFTRLVLFRGFGDDGRGYADTVLSGRLVWDLIRKEFDGRLWKCEDLDFERSGCVRLRPGARQRPKGFYWGKVHAGSRYQTFSASEFRRLARAEAAFSHEGFQMIGVTHPHLITKFGGPDLPSMSLADYDVAPYGFGDYFDVPQLFCMKGVLALGLGHVERNYPAFGIPTVLLS